MTVIHCADVQFTDISAVFFDKDGTLACVEPFLQDLTRQFIQQLEQRIPEVAGGFEDLALRYGVSSVGVDPNGVMAVGSRQACEAIAVEALLNAGIRPNLTPADVLSIVQQAFAEAEQLLPPKASYTPLIPGILDLLSRLRQQNVAIGILTSDTPANLNAFIAHYGLERWVQISWGSDPGKLRKPDPQFYRQACATLGIPVERTLMVGDAEADCRMAKLAGASAVGVTWGWSDRLPHFVSADVQLTQTTAFRVGLEG